MGDLIAMAIIVVVLGAAGHKICSNKKKSSCGCGCSGCSSKGNCPSSK